MGKGKRKKDRRRKGDSADVERKSKGTSTANNDGAAPLDKRERKKRERAERKKARKNRQKDKWSYEKDEIEQYNKQLLPLGLCVREIEGDGNCLCEF